MASKIHLLNAIHEGRADSVHAVLREHPEFARQATARYPFLVSAGATGNLEVLEALLDAGADPSACDASGGTALHSASDHGHARTVRRLLEGGAPINSIDGIGATALDFAVASGHQEVVEVLRCAGGESRLEVRCLEPAPNPRLSAIFDRLPPAVGVPLARIELIAMRRKHPLHDDLRLLWQRVDGLDLGRARIYAVRGVPDTAEALPDLPDEVEYTVFGEDVDGACYCLRRAGVYAIYPDERNAYPRHEDLAAFLENHQAG
ncbi:MAG: ankyrin repeat domain-containing protein [Candidatus Eremiobacterota bacterium]